MHVFPVQCRQNRQLCRQKPESRLFQQMKFISPALLPVHIIKATRPQRDGFYNMNRCTLTGKKRNKKGKTNQLNPVS